MIKKSISIVILCFIVSAIGFGLMQEDITEITISDNIQFQKSETIDLDFKNSNIELISWDNDYVKIVGTDLLERQKEDNKQLQIKVTNNTIKLENFKPTRLISSNLYTWLPILQLEKYRGDYVFLTRSHFKVYLPEGVRVKVYAKKVTTKGEITVINNDSELIKNK